MSYCSPNVNVTGIGNHYTCFDHDELKEIALALNIYIQKNKLCLLESSNKLKSKTCSTKIINISKKTIATSTLIPIKYLVSFCLI